MKRLLFVLLVLAALGDPLGAQERPLRMAMSLSSWEANPQRADTGSEAQLLTALWEGLTVYDPETLTAKPGVAESWTWDAASLTWTFRLRPNAVFSDGEPVTAQTFRQSWLALLTGSRNAPFASLLDDVRGARDFRLGRGRGEESVGLRALDSRTLAVTLEGPAPHFPVMVAHYAFSPLPAALLARHPRLGFGSSVAGNGPYLLTRNEGHSLIFEKNPRYWDAGSVAISRLEITLRDEASEITGMFRRGELDWALDGIDFEQPLAQGSLQVLPLFSTSYYFFQNTQGSWRDARVRRALLGSLPLEDLRAQQMLPAQTLVPNFEPYPARQSLSALTEAEARALLEAAGYPGGRGLPPIRVLIPESPELIRQTQLMEAAWGRLFRLPVMIETVPWRNYYSRLEEKHTYDIGFQSWIGDFPDPLTFLLMWQDGSSLNQASHTSAEYDRLLTEARVLEGRDRLAVLARAEESLLQSGAVLPLGHNAAFHLIDRSVIGGWHPNPLDIHPFKALFFARPPSLPNVARR